MNRFKVIRKSVRWNKQTYHVGEYLPESFTEKDMYRVLYPSRIQKEKVVQKEQVEKSVQPVVSVGTKNAESTPAAPVKTTGAPLSGAKVTVKKK